MSWQQKERQSTRAKKTGRYTKLNPCEGCGKSAGANYYSDDRCNSRTWAGRGLVLCSRCGAKLENMGDVEGLAWLVEQETARRAK